MTAQLTTGDHLDLGDTWVGVLLVTDLDGVPAAADTVTVAVTLPDGSSVAGTAETTATVGLYVLAYDTTATGRHTIAVTVTSAEFGDDVITAAAEVTALAGALPTLVEVIAYLGETSWSEQDIADALTAETAAQARRCRLPADYPEDLGQALKRRVARNLAARSVPVASFITFEGGGTSTRVPMLDAEIVRLEAPWRRLVVG